jgi:hypothetical protein
LNPTLVDDLEGFKTSVEEGTADVVEIARQLELEVEPEDVTELLQPRGKLQRISRSFLWMRTEWFREMEWAPGEDAVNTVEMTSKDVEYYT